ncbi:MAG: SGNH/GDSL hydrolase family protein [Bacteroidales bacterium]|nr:SGNH/GDSL hydrolase family protein [Bacteroidales bacterium]
MKRYLITFLIFLLPAVGISAQTLGHSQWEGRKVAFLGDSITDARQVEKTNNVYWNFLAEMLGFEPYVYGISGHRMNQIQGQAEKLIAEHGMDFDAIIVFVGTNDYNGSIPMGEWYTFDVRETLDDGPAMQRRKHRQMSFDPETFKGRTNVTLRYLKQTFPDKQIIFLTPIHRAFAMFSDRNVQPDESFANDCGLFVDDYVQAIKEIANIWAVPVIDLNSICGLYPLLDEHAHYFRNAEKDRLHPNTPGQLRMAYALAYQLLAYPSYFPKQLAFCFSSSLPSKTRTKLVSALKAEGANCSFADLPLSQEAAPQASQLRDGDIVYLLSSNPLEEAVALARELKQLGFSIMSAEELYKVRGFDSLPEDWSSKTNVY